ncbi:hypothetical protein M1B34_12150 [Pseudomonas sp. MAFF 302030]|uniref:Uncharacterized protein n=1 Tax=Pseudomonas morbosilactucae TaxID=2938197 RepID=A0A9X2C5Q0_9PSED|nr:hypothetical protein [Pseudomonas morbosilactucae]
MIRQLQAYWLSDVRSSCETSDCLEATYRAQVKLLGPVPIPALPNPDQLRPLAPGQHYTVSESDNWPRFTLATFTPASIPGDQQIVDAQVIDNVLHVVLFVGRYLAGEPTYVGTLYEYRDDRPGLHAIAKDVAFVGWSSPGSNDQGIRFSGIVDGVLYYRQHIGGNLQKAMSYRLGSRSPAEESQHVFQAASNTHRHALARVREQLNESSNSLSLQYDAPTQGSYQETITDQNEPDDGWSIVNPTWSATRPVLYFDNSGAKACVWRVDVRLKVLSKIVPEHEAMSARPVDIFGREAVVYLQGGQLKFAMQPDD